MSLPLRLYIFCEDGFKSTLLELRFDDWRLANDLAEINLQVCHILPEQKLLKTYDNFFDIVNYILF